MIRQRYALLTVINIQAKLMTMVINRAVTHFTSQCVCCFMVFSECSTLPLRTLCVKNSEADTLGEPSLPCALDFYGVMFEISVLVNSGDVLIGIFNGIITDLEKLLIT